MKFLPKSGQVGNLTVKDFIAVSSIIPEKQESDQELGGDNAEESESSGSGESDAILFNVASALSQAQFDTRIPDEPRGVSDDDFTSNRPLTALDERGDVFTAATETTAAPPVTPPSETVLEFEEPPQPEQPQLFDARLLQVARIDGIENIMGVDTRVIRGGGGSDASFSNPANEAQFSTETIDATADTSDVIVFGDDPDNFGETVMTRVFEIEPLLGAGFVVDRISLDNLPAGYTITNAVQNGTEFILEMPMANDRNAFEFIIQYTIPNENQFVFIIKYSG